MAKIEKRLSKATGRTESVIEEVGKSMVKAFHLLALFVIGGTIVWAAVFAFIGMMGKGRASIEDILLLFIYLELGAMVGIYFYTNHMPVRFLIYVGMTALTRQLIGFISVEHTPNEGVLIISGAILLLAFGVLVLRFGSYKYPSKGREALADASQKEGLA